jgi:hypothetical protein
MQVVVDNLTVQLREWGILCKAWRNLKWMCKFALVSVFKFGYLYNELIYL